MLYGVQIDNVREKKIGDENSSPEELIINLFNTIDEELKQRKRKQFIFFARYVNTEEILAKIDSKKRIIIMATSKQYNNIINILLEKINKET